MIIQPTTEQTRRVDRSRAYSGTGFGPRSFACLGLGVGIGIGMGLGAGGNVPGSDGNFAPLFTGVMQALSTSRGMSYGSTLLASGTTPPVLTFTGTISGAYVPVRVECTLLGALGVWTGRVSYDGGSTFPQTFTSAATVACTGAGAGLTLNIAAGAAVVDNAWKATCSQVDDYSGAALHAVQATAGRQPVVTIGANAKAGVAFDGVDDFLNSSTFPAQAAPGTTPLFIWIVYRMISTPSANAYVVIGQGGSSALLVQASSNAALQLNNVLVNARTVANGAWNRCEAFFNNAVTDYQKVGAGLPATGTSAGNNATAAGRSIGGFGTAANANMELLDLIYLNNAPTTPQLAAASAAVLAYYNGQVAA